MLKIALVRISRVRHNIEDLSGLSRGLRKWQRLIVQRLRVWCSFGFHCTLKDSAWIFSDNSFHFMRIGAIWREEPGYAEISWSLSRYSFVYKAEHEWCHGYPVHHRRRKGLFVGRTKPPRQYLFVEDQVCTYLSLVAFSSLEKRQPPHSFSIFSPQRVSFFRSKVSSQMFVLCSLLNSSL